MTVGEGILEAVLGLAVAHSMVAAAKGTRRGCHHTADQGTPYSPMTGAELSWLMFIVKRG